MTPARPGVAVNKRSVDLMYYNGDPPADDLITLADDNDPLVKKLYAALLKRARELIKNVHEKKTVPGDIDKEMISLTHQILMDGVTKGLKVDWDKVDYETDDGKKLHALQTHVFKFSACKNYQEVLAMGRNLTDGKGNIRSFEEFRKVAGKIDATFNGKWLKTEYDQAQVTATRIADYRRMEDMTDLYPTWQYKTRDDGHVREPHKALHNMKLAANDPAWDAIYPQNGWNCRCWVKPLSEDPPHTGKGEEAITKLRSTIVNKKTGMSEWDNMVKQGFNQNFAKTGTCYPVNHQFFKAGDEPSVKNVVGEYNRRGSEVIKTYKNGGSVSVHNMVDRTSGDFPDLALICDQFAQMGHKTKILPKPNFKDPVYKEVFGSLIGTKYERKCPDISVNGLFYELEGHKEPETKRSLSNMLSRGFKQSSRIIIDELKKSTDYHIKMLIHNHIREGQVIDEVWINEKGRIRLLYKKQ